MKMPEPDAGVLARRGEIVRALRAIVGTEGVIDDVAALRAYESDGLTAYRQPPLAVCLPTTTEEVAAVLKAMAARGVFPWRSSSRMRSKMMTFASIAMPTVSTTPAIPGRVSVAPASDMTPTSSTRFASSARLE